MEGLKREIAATIASTRSELTQQGRTEVGELPELLPDLPEQQLEFHVQEVEVKRSVTLYSATATPEFFQRKTEPKDIATLMTYVTQDAEGVFNTTDAGLVYERSCFSLVLVDQIETGKLAAHASFDDSPMDPMVNMDGKRWASELDLEGITPLNTLFMHLCLINNDYAADVCLAELIASTFLACTGISNLILECPTVDYEGPYLFTNLAWSFTYSPRPTIMKKLIIYEKDKLFPHLIVREGREHDLDDLASQMAVTTEEMQENFGGRCYLSDLVALADRNNQSMVAEFQEKAVGIAIVTTDINYKFLNRNFHLEAFHGLHKPHQDDIVHIEPQQSAFKLFGPAETDDEYYFKDEFSETPSKHRVFQTEQSSVEEMPEVESKYSEMSTPAPKPQPPKPAEELNGAKGEATNPEEAKSSRKSVLAAINASGQASGASSHHQTMSILKQYAKAVPKDGLVNDLEHEIVKSRASSVRHLEQVDEIVSTLEDDGLSLETAELDEVTLKVLEEADKFIQLVASAYLHRVLNNEKRVPVEDWSAPPISRYKGLPNAIAIQLLTMDKKFHTRFEDLINGTLDKFPNRDYVIIAVPSHLPEPHWTKHFTLVVKRKNSVYAKSLYVLHRIAFSSTLTVRNPTEYDLDKIETFLSTIIGGDKILEDVERSFIDKWEPDEPPQKGFKSVSATQFSRTQEFRPMLPFIMTARDLYDADPVVVGLAMISNEPEPAFYQVNYNLDSYSYANDHKPSDYGYVHHFLLSPLFQKYSRLFMKEILRRTKKHFAFHKLLPLFETKDDWVCQSVLNNIEDWFPLGPRKRINYHHLNLKDIYDEDRQPSPTAQDYSNPSGAIYFSKKFLFEPKSKVGGRIVFIGASDTTISAVEKLIFGSHFTFKHLTIISPNGLPGSLGPDATRNLFFARSGSPALSMTSDDEWHHRLGLRNHVSVVHGTVTKVMRNMQMVLVNEKKVVRYDLLIICAGRQFIRPDSPVQEIHDEHFIRYHESINQQIASDYLEERVFEPPKPFKELSAKPDNVFLMNMDLDAAAALNFLRKYVPLNNQRHIIVHGACLEAYCCITALQQMKIDAKRIVLVTTPDEVMDWEKQHGYTDTPKLKEVMSNSLKHLGVRVVNNYVFRKWKVEDSSNLATKIHFYSPTKKTRNISISCLAYFPFVVRRVPDEMANVLTECFLGYNNGVLIDTAFRTLDPNIWAAGPCTAYNKALCAEKIFHGFYSSYEIGKLVSDLIIKKFEPTADICIVNTVKPGQSLLPPLLTAPIVRYAALPDGWFYLHLRPPGFQVQCCHGECTCPDCECGTEVVTGSIDDKMFMPTQKYFRLWLNSYHRVEGLECISRTEFSPSNLASLYGHHEVFLNKLMDQVEKGEVQDLYVYFEQPWIGAICHDRWIGFREELQDTFADFDIGPNLKIYNFIRDYLDNLDNPNAFKVDPNILRRIFENSGLKSLLELKFLEFLKYNRAVIPMFARPDFVEELFEERETSAVYFPQIPNF